MKVIGLGHRKRVGKDTFARELASEFLLNGRQARVMAFAGPLYDVAEELYGWDGMKDMAYYYENGAAKEEMLFPIGKTPRQILIELGMAVRGIYAETWIELLKCRVRELEGRVALVVVVDTRFANETEAIKVLGGEVWRIDRPDLPHTDDAADRELADYTEWDRIIVNSGNEHQLRTMARTVAQELLRTS